MIIKLADVQDQNWEHNLRKAGKTETFPVLTSNLIEKPNVSSKTKWGQVIFICI